MSIEEYKVRIDNILSSIDRHAQMMEKKEYTTREELSRDMAIGIELGQQYVDMLGEILEDDEVLMVEW